MGLPMVEWQPETKRRGLYRPSNFAKHIRILQNYWKVRSTTGLPVGLYFATLIKICIVVVRQGSWQNYL